jgi:cytoskeleton protein RodZ
MTDQLATTGPRLKAERERRGLSSQKAADELHLDGWIIDALEAEDYQRIGPSVYAKGHLKRYAALLGLPPAEIVAGYESRAQAPRPPAQQTVSVRVRTDAPAASRPPWLRIAGCAALLLAIGVFWWKPWHPHAVAAAAAPPAVPNAASSGNSSSGNASSGSEASDNATGIDAAAPSGAGSPAAASSSGVLLAASASAAPEPDAMAGSGHARLRLSFSADSWVDVHDAAGRRVFAGNGRANSVKTVAGIAPMRVYLGFASGVQLEINDHAVAIGPQFVAGDVARFEAGADGVLRRDSQARSARPTG